MQFTFIGTTLFAASVLGIFACGQASQADGSAAGAAAVTSDPTNVDYVDTSDCGKTVIAIFDAVNIADTADREAALRLVLDENYVSKQPYHPDLNFVGPDGAVTHWNEIHALIPDVHATLNRCVRRGRRVWADAEAHGTITTPDGNVTPFNQGGVFEFRIVDESEEEVGRAAWGRVWFDPLNQPAASKPGVDADAGPG